MDRRRYWYLIHSRRLKHAWKGKWKTCFNTLEGWYRTVLQPIIYDAILIALTSRGFLYLSLHIAPCALTFSSLEISCKPLWRREAGYNGRLKWLIIVIVIIIIFIAHINYITKNTINKRKRKFYKWQCARSPIITIRG